MGCIYFNSNQNMYSRLGSIVNKSNFCTVNRKWELLKPTGDCPPSLQEHTAVTFRENIYIFGGELGFYGDNETPLWIYESQVSNFLSFLFILSAADPEGISPFLKRKKV